jgi:colanic acid biosynthesis glycosyl transferase WcaI
VAQARELSNVRFRPPQPRARLNETLGLADLHLVTLRAGCEHFVFPSKFHGIVAAGRPLLFVGPPAAEPARLMHAHGLGLAFAPEDTTGLAAAVRRLAGDPGQCALLAGNVRTYAAIHESRARWAEAWNRVFGRIAAGGAAGGRAMKPLAG